MACDERQMSTRLTRKQSPSFKRVRGAILPWGFSELYEELTEARSESRVIDRWRRWWDLGHRECSINIESAAELSSCLPA